jgi:hypothetical protein
MPDTVTVSLPDDLSAKVQAIAKNNNQSVEEVMINYVRSFAKPLPNLEPDLQAELDALQYLSDDALWTIARSVMPQEIQNRMQVLMTKNTKGALTPIEQSELQKLVDRGERLMLLKSEAMALLTKRGHTISRENLLKFD